jgi:choline dehydrogenase-like flavoprotein
VRTSFNDNKLQIEDDIIKACDDVAGYSKKPIDPWSGDHLGFFNTLTAVARTGPNRGKRSYAGRGYIEANKERPNLKVLCEALVNKVNLEGNKAVGANITVGGRQYDISAKREIIVCGGTVKSPQILELSGIGDPDVLRAAGVECKIENRGVGANFQDHSMSLVAQSVKPGVITMDTLHQVPEVMQAALKQYMETADGPISSVASMQGFLSFKKLASEEELKSVIQSIRDIKPTSEFHKQQLQQIIDHLESDKSANLQLVVVSATPNLETGVQHQAVLFPPRPADKPAGLLIAMCLQYPVARGYIHIDSPGRSSKACFARRPCR